MTPSTHQFCLQNGLKVLLKETHSAPVTSVWLWYRVGSRNETEGATGVSHWVEHMMFKGSSQFAKGSIMRAVDRQGGYVNAMTSHDYTAYYATLPSDRAELALQIEADRMLGAMFDPDEVNAERTVIIAEREGAENEPEYVLGEEVAASAYRIHPYHHQTIGWKEDLLQISREQLYAHYRQYYMPNNAVLVIVGDVDLDAYRGLVERYFGDLEAGTLSQAVVRQEPPQRGERRVVVRMPGSTPVVQLSYHTPPVSHADYVPLVVLDAILSGGKAMFAFGGSPARSARLYRALVETELASSAGSNYHPSLDPYLLTLGATLREGREPGEIEQALVRETTRLAEEAIDEHELRVAIRQTQAQFAYSSEGVTNQALTLGFLEMVDHHERMDRILDELAAITPDDIQRVARTYLVADNLVAGWFVPSEEGGGATGISGPRQYRPQPQGSRRARTFSASGGPTISPETVVRHEYANGVVLLIKEVPASASVTVEGEIMAGSVHDTPETAGLAAMTAAMLRRGTERHCYQALNRILDDVGAAAGFMARRDRMSFDGEALYEDFCLLADTLAEVVTTPTFPDEELAKLRGQMLTHLGVMAMDTGYRADRAFMSALYPPDHPYALAPAGERETVAVLSREDLATFYRSQYSPTNCRISVVGAVQADRVIETIGNTLGSWNPQSVPQPWNVPSALTPDRIVTERVHIPGKSQVDLIWGVTGMPRSAPDYYAASMANLILGRLGLMGRLGESVRDSQGLAYYVASSLQAGPGVYPWNIVAGVNPQDVDRAVASILHEVARLREELVEAEEIDDCRSYLTGALPLHLETNGGIAAFLLTLEKHGLGLDYLERYPSLIGAVTREEIQRVVQEYLTLDRYVLAMAGTFAETPEPSS